MKNLPNEFPIQYAVIVKDLEKDDFIKNPLLETKEDKFLFRELINHLQASGLTKKNIDLNVFSFNINASGLNLLQINKLATQNNDRYADFMRWSGNMGNILDTLYPNIDLSKTTNSRAKYSLGLYSYNASWIPSFIRGYKALEKGMNYNTDLIDWFGTHYNDFLETIYNLYQRIKLNINNSKELYTLASNFEKPIYIDIPYTDIWKDLDRRINDGIIPNISLLNRSEYLSNITSVSNKYTKKIRAVVCLDWKALFVEELYALLKLFSYCNNCGKALPIGFSGSYCPDDENCLKERGRKRKNKQLNKNCEKEW